MKTTFTCTAGHTHTMSEDLGDPADRHQVLEWQDRMRGEVHVWECPTRLEDGVQCHGAMTRTIQDESRDRDPYDDDQLDY